MERAPQASHIVPGSTPIVSFGNLYSANTVTIGINPSVDEFMTRHKPRKLLASADKRLIDYETLGLANGSEINLDHAERILGGCFDYFNRNPYSWFNRMETYLVNPSGSSYFDGTAAHLDLVQWATDPVWQNITDKQIAKNLIDRDKKFLEKLLEGANYEKILLNGSTVVETVRSLGLFDLEVVGKIQYGGNSSSLLQGIFGKTVVKATTLNIPSARGLEGPQKIADWLAN